jgi:hypothetical protein
MSLVAQTPHVSKRLTTVQVRDIKATAPDDISINQGKSPTDLTITMPKSHPGTNIQVEGITETIAVKVDWKKVVEFGLDLLGIGGSSSGGGGGGGSKGCWTNKTTTPEGATISITICPPPA